MIQKDTLYIQDSSMSYKIRNTVYLSTLAPSDSSDQPMHLQNLVRLTHIHLKTTWISAWSESLWNAYVLNNILRETDTLGRFSTVFLKRDNFSVSCTSTPFWKRVYSKR